MFSPVFAALRLPLSRRALCCGKLMYKVVMRLTHFIVGGLEVGGVQESDMDR